ncbi:hypothetical protein GCM10008932_10430 [Alkalibacterium iburiense]|uniref:Bacterial Ig-like domain-containing protein n=1 Tax=Alkalibacterium iburiense TaxID=290589 RepID=A0ABN0XB14_9LACT
MTRQTRKLFSFFGIVCMVILLWACTGPEAEPTPYEEVNTLRGVRLTLDKEVYESEDDRFLLTVHNDSSKEVTYGVAYTLEKLNNHQWYVVEPEEEIAFIMIAHILGSGEEAQEEINLDFYEPLEPGHYRIVREIEGEVLTAEFQVR